MESYMIKCRECGTDNVITRSNCRKCNAILNKEDILTNNENNGKNRNPLLSIKNNSINATNINPIAKLLRVFGLITILAGIITFFIFIEDNFFTGLILVISSIISGFFILGFSEVIQKLQNIEDNTKNNR